MPELTEPLIRQDERTRIAAQIETVIAFLKATGPSESQFVAGQILALITLQDRLLNKRRRRA